jgi:hypothetical protein
MARATLTAGGRLVDGEERAVRSNCSPESASPIDLSHLWQVDLCDAWVKAVLRIEGERGVRVWGAHPGNAAREGWSRFFVLESTSLRSISPLDSPHVPGCSSVDKILEEICESPRVMKETSPARKRGRRPGETSEVGSSQSNGTVPSWYGRDSRGRASLVPT